MTPSSVDNHNSRSILLLRDQQHSHSRCYARFKASRCPIPIANCTASHGWLPRRLTLATNKPPLPHHAIILRSYRAAKSP